MAAPDHLQGLNEPQRQAVETLEGPLLILAGAGSGKTRVLTRRIAHLLHSGVKPWRILAVTFTNKAAQEMKERVRELVGEEAAHSLWVSTFHSACARILRQEAPNIGLSGHYVVWDDDDQLRVLKQILKDLKLDPKVHPPRNFRAKIDRAKNKLWGPDEWLLHGVEQAGSTAMRVFRAYEERLAASSAVDFNDLINKVVLLFRTRPDRLERWQDRFHYLLVDEYQDTNRAQYELVKLLASKRRNLAVVGDDDQSIYSFRGADIRNILDFEQDFEDATVVRLEQNYRSSQKILAAAMAVVRNNKGRKDKTLWTAGTEGDAVKLLVGADEQEEAALVLQDMATQRRKGRDFSDLAVIYRTNASSRPFEQALERRRWPYVVVGARRFYERREVRDLLAYVRLVLNPADDMALVRILNVPRRGLGAKAVEAIRTEAATRGTPLTGGVEALGKGSSRRSKSLATFHAHLVSWREKALRLSPGELVATIAAESGYVDMLQAEDTDEARGRLGNLDELARDAEEELVEDSDEPLARLQAWLDRVSLAGQADELPDVDGRVTLLTAHLAKGLEFPVVYVAGMVEGSFPHVRSSDHLEDIEEERRLTYVAFTRAQERLVISRPRMRRQWGGRAERASRSRFLDEIPDTLTTGGGKLASFYGRRTSRPSSSGLSDDQQQRMDTFLAQHRRGAKKVPRPAVGTTLEPEDLSAYAPGTRVVHPTYGEGEIQRISGSPHNQRLTVHFRRHGPITLMARNAKLEVVVG